MKLDDEIFSKFYKHVAEFPRMPTRIEINEDFDAIFGSQGPKWENTTASSDDSKTPHTTRMHAHMLLSHLPGWLRPFWNISAWCVHQGTFSHPGTLWRCWRPEKTSNMSTQSRDWMWHSWRTRGSRLRRVIVSMTVCLWLIFIAKKKTQQRTGTSLFKAYKTISARFCVFKC